MNRRSAAAIRAAYYCAEARRIEQMAQAAPGLGGEMFRVVAAEYRSLAEELSQEDALPAEPPAAQVQSSYGRRCETADAAVAA